MRDSQCHDALQIVIMHEEPSRTIFNNLLSYRVRRWPHLVSVCIKMFSRSSTLCSCLDAYAQSCETAQQLTAVCSGRNVNEKLGVTYW